MTTDTCPFCNSPKEEWHGCKDDVAQYYEEKFTCGFDYNLWSRGVPRPEECYEAQIAALQQRLEAWRDLYKDYPWKDQRCVQKLKDLGEIA